MPSSEPKPLHQIHEDEHDEDSPYAKRVLPYGWDSGNTTKRRLAANASGELLVVDAETVPTDGTKNNESYSLTFNGDDELTNIAMTIGGTTYNRTITWTSGNPTAVSAWSAA